MKNLKLILIFGFILIGIAVSMPNWINKESEAVVVPIPKGIHVTNSYFENDPKNTYGIHFTNTVEAGFTVTNVTLENKWGTNLIELRDIDTNSFTVWTNKNDAFMEAAYELGTNSFTDTILFSSGTNRVYFKMKGREVLEWPGFIFPRLTDDEWEQLKKVMPEHIHVKE